MENSYLKVLLFRLLLWGGEKGTGKKNVKENTFYIYVFTFFVKVIFMSGNSLVHNPLTGTSPAVGAQPP